LGCNFGNFERQNKFGAAPIHQSTRLFCHTFVRPRLCWGVGSRGAHFSTGDHGSREPMLTY
jgi:hypothetical protein